MYRHLCKVAAGVWGGLHFTHISGGGLHAAHIWLTAAVDACACHSCIPSKPLVCVRYNGVCPAQHNTCHLDPTFPNLLVN